MHLIFERSKGRFKSNCNILSLAWMPFYKELTFRQSLFEYHQKQLINLTSSIARDNNNFIRQLPENYNNNNNDQIGDLARNLNARLNANRQQANGGQRDQVNEENDPTPDSHELFHLNSRLAELHQRYLHCKGTNSGANNNNGDKFEQKFDAPSMSQELDQKYGKRPQFGWLVLGNVGKLIGVTLTSLLPPQVEPKRSNLKSTLNSDLMQFNDTDQGLDESAFGLVSSSNSNDSCRRPDSSSVRSNYNLRGHLDEVILVRWNELYQKLATVDSKGNVLIWCKLNEKFTIQTPFYNRTKSVADFRWSNDGKTALICYTNSFILVGSSSGQRHWHSMLNLDDYHITCASWSPDDKQLLLGVSNGNVVVIDLPRSELTELVVNQYNIRTMCWSSCELTMKDLTRSKRTRQDTLMSEPESKQNPTNNDSETATTTTVVNHRRLSRDCSVFSKYRFCSMGPSSEGNQTSARPGNVCSSSSSRLERKSFDQRNILAIDFANNSIKLYDGGLQDPKPKSILVNQESYTMHWSSNGQVLAVAGFTIHTTAPSVGMLKCRYLNSIKFYDQEARLIHEHAMTYTRYPITAFTWAHDDQRLFVATGPRLHCAKVCFGIPALSLLASSCLFKQTKLPDKIDVLDNIVQNRPFSKRVFNWQSENCPIDILSERRRLLKSTSTVCCDDGERTKKQVQCNNSNVFQFKLPAKLQFKIDQLFDQTIGQPFEEQWSLNDIIWHVPNNEQRYYCTLVCYASDLDLNSSGFQYRTNPTNDRTMSNSGAARANNGAAGSDQNKIFVLYVEFQGSLIPILRARRVGFLKPEFVIFDPEDNQNRVLQRQQRKVSDISQQTSFQPDRPKNSGNILPVDVSFMGENIATNFMENCADFHQCPSEHRPSSSSASYSKHSIVSDAEHYYNFTGFVEDPSSRKQEEEQFVSELASGRSHCQEPIALPMTSSPYLLYMMNLSSGSAASAGFRQGSKFDQKMLLRDPSPHHHHQPQQRPHQSNLLVRRKLRASGLSNCLTENRELVRIRSNIWGTKFKLINVGNRMIKQRSILGSVAYKASILHLQPRQIYLNIKDMSNYCCLCSKHHHTRLPKLDRPSDRTNQPSLLDLPNVEGPLISPLEQERSSRSSLRRGTCSDQKVVMQFGDAIRIAPKLEGNQEYRYVSRQSPIGSKPSTTRCPTQSASSVHRRKFSHNYVEQSTSTGNGPRNKSVDARDHENDESDDVLTLSLDQQNQNVRVEMRVSEKRPDRSSFGAESAREEQFLAANKTLKSIQSITKMIVDLSSKASTEQEELADFAHSSSPYKASRLNIEGDSSASRRSPKFSLNYVTPDAPVHRPRRVSGAAGSHEFSKNRAQSVTTTPLRMTENHERRSSDRPHRDRRRRGQNFSRSKTSLDGADNPLPAPPVLMPIGRRLSLSAKRFFDGSLRPLYNAYSSSDVEPEESEPLIKNRSASSARTSGGVGRRLMNASQPCSPAKGFQQQFGKQSIDLSLLKAQVTSKIKSKWLFEGRWASSSQLEAETVEKSREKTNWRELPLESSLRAESSDSDFSSSDDDIDLHDQKAPIKPGARAGPLKNHDGGFTSASMKNLHSYEFGQTSGPGELGQPHRSSRKRSRRRIRQKSICSNNDCCCAKEFKLNNRKPVWNDLSQVYQLDFGGRVTQESAKNLQVDFGGNLALQFGRIDRCTYTLDYKYPFNAVQAMAIALASLTQRLK